MCEALKKQLKSTVSITGVNGNLQARVILKIDRELNTKTNGCRYENSCNFWQSQKKC